MESTAVTLVKTALKGSFVALIAPTDRVLQTDFSSSLETAVGSLGGRLLNAENSV